MIMPHNTTVMAASDKISIFVVPSIPYNYVAGNITILSSTVPASILTNIGSLLCIDTLALSFQIGKRYYQRELSRHYIAGNSYHKNRHQPLTEIVNYCTNQVFARIQHWVLRILCLFLFHLENPLILIAFILELHKRQVIIDIPHYTFQIVQSD